MVIETLLHMLVERGVVPLDQVLQTLETSIDTKRTLAADGIHEEISARAAGVLSQMANSLAAGSARLPRI
jgi:phage-related minor tail protein